MIDKVEAFYGKLAAREKVLFMIAAVFIFFALVDNIVLRPVAAHMQLMDIDIKSKSEAIRRDMRIVSFREGILRDYSHYIKYLDSGDKSQEEIIASLLRKIETVAAEKSVAILNIQSGDSSAKSSFKEYKATLACEGPLKNILGLMHELEESDYLFRITKYDFVPKSKGADIMKANIEMSRVLVGAEKVENEVLEEFLKKHPQDVSLPAEETQVEEADADHSNMMQNAVPTDLPNMTATPTPPAIDVPAAGQIENKEDLQIPESPSEQTPILKEAESPSSSATS